MELKLKLSYSSSYEEIERYYDECLDYWKHENSGAYSPEELALIDVENYMVLPIARDVEISEIAKRNFIKCMKSKNLPKNKK